MKIYFCQNGGAKEHYRFLKKREIDLLFSYAYLEDDVFGVMSRLKEFYNIREEKKMVIYFCHSGATGQYEVVRRRKIDILYAFDRFNDPESEDKSFIRRMIRDFKRVEEEG